MVYNLSKAMNQIPDLSRAAGRRGERRGADTCYVSTARPKSDKLIDPIGGVIPRLSLNQTNGWGGKASGAYRRVGEQGESRINRLDHLKMRRGIEYKQTRLVYCKAKKDGTFTGYASVFGCVDYDGDVMMKGAFSRSLTQWQHDRRWPLLLWQHDVKEPIGYCTHLREDAHGLAMKGQFMLELRRGREAYVLAKGRYLKGLSIGFVPQKTRRMPNQGIRLIEQVDLREVSLVTFPANAKAQITQV